MSKPIFEVIVVATMSAGKSTVINALIGHELLHSANEATTATITRIHDKDELPYFSGGAYDYQGNLLVEDHQINSDTLRKWNADRNIKKIDLVGNIQAIHSEDAEIVIYDTPGPNNSQDDDHEELTMEVIDDGNYGLILYILNATQLGINDDRYLLEKIQKSLEEDPHKEIIFLLNKADMLDEEKGEHLSDVVARAENYLEKIGFINPVILPTAANYALVVGKAINKEPLTRTQRANLKATLEFEGNKYIENSTLSLLEKLEIEENVEKLKSTPSNQLEWIQVTDQYLTTRQHLLRTAMRTGFGAVQYLLQEKLSKKFIYSLDARRQNISKIEDSDSRLNKMVSLVKEAQKNPFVMAIMNKRVNQIPSYFERALDKNFYVYVAATMSAGKSTLINAMLGTDLLPAANEATTATLAQITDNDSMQVGHFSGRRFNKRGIEVDALPKVSLETLKEWNTKDDTKLIQLEGNIIGIKERENVRLVITDTPGTNNSQDPEHARAIMEHIQDSKRNPLILYILNATQLGTYDDQRVLGEIAQIMKQGGKQAQERFIFVVNKMDAFAPYCGDNILAELGRVIEYLKNSGIEYPSISPVSANLARLLRKREEKPDELTRKERGDLMALEDLFTEEPPMDLVQYMSLTSSAHRKLNTKRLPKLLERSGVPAIEVMIDEYIDKYHIPYRINQAYQAIIDSIYFIRSIYSESLLAGEYADYMENLEDIKTKLEKIIHN